MRTRAAEAVYRASLFVLPFALAFAYVLFLLGVLTPEAWYLVVIGGMVTYLLAPVGTEVVIPVIVVGLLALAAPGYAFILGIASIVLIDVLASLFITWNWDLLERVPYLGRGLRRVEAKCREVIARKKWGERATLTALALYVALPVQMTGGLFSTVLGDVMGLDRRKVFLAVVAGSAAGAVPMGIAAYVAGPPLLAALSSVPAKAVATAAGILITVALVATVVLLYRRSKRNANPT